MTNRARGPFDVRMAPQEQDGESPVTRFTLDKRYHGDLEAVSRGQMLAVNTDTPDSAGYVALEWVTGALHGQSGAFALQHSGTMTRGEPWLSVTVVPDSATGALTGLAGQMQIEIADGAHTYDFSYTLPDSR